ncbi:MAG TPA: hypothetical protein PKE45_10080, partial [Caldilineaceae bacterium]|nr:hypothetical protein [Caldilineaceae bacterium]
LSFWFRTGQEGMALFFGNSDDGNTFDSVLTSMSIRISSGVELRFANWAEVDANPSTSLLDGLDHYVALVFAQAASSAQATVTLYVDGVQLKSLDVSLSNEEGEAISLSGSPLYIATRPPDYSQDNPIRNSDAFPGRVTDLRIWSHVLSDAEIANDQWSTVFGQEPGLYLAIPLDEQTVDRSSEKALDLSPAHHDAVTTIIQDDMKYLYFEPSLAAFPVGSRTVELWLRCGYNTGGQILVSYADVSSSDHPNDGGVPWFVTLSDLRSAIRVTDGAWHHIAVVVDAEAHADTIYVDGLQQYRGPRSTPGQVAGQPFLIGAQTTDANDQLFAGLIKDVYLWSSIRSEEQIWDSAGGKRPTADATLVLNVLKSQDDTSEPDESAPAVLPKHCLTLSSDQRAIGTTPSSDPDNPIEIDDYTVVMMVRPSKAGALFARLERQADGLHGFSISCTENGGLQVSEREGSRFRITRYDPGQSGLSLLDGFRHSVAFRCLDDLCAIFVDGMPVAVSQQTSADNPLTIDVNSLGAVQIGGADPAETNPESAPHFAGDVFMMAYWNLGLDPTDIHKAGFDLMDGLYTSMLGYWPFNQTLEDQSYLGDDLTMSTAGWFYPAVKTVWAQSPSSPYRFHHIEGIAHRQREGERDVSITHIVDVPVGAAFLYGGLTGRGRQLAPPTGVAVSVTDPNEVHYTSEADTDALFVKIRDAGVRAFVVKEPTPGKWQIAIRAHAQDDFIFQAHVLPTQGAADEIHTALKPLFGTSAPVLQQQERFSVASVLDVIATTALAAVIAVTAVAGGVVVSPIAVPLLLLFGVARAAAEIVVTSMDRADRINACNQTAAQTMPREPVSTPVSGSTLQVLDSLKFPKPTQPDGPSRLNFVIPADAVSFSFHVLLDTTQFSIGGRMSLVLTGPNGVKIPTGGEPFLYSNQLVVTNTGLSQGYCAVSAPINQTQAASLSGQWEAKLDLAGIDPANIQVRLCIRTRPVNSPAPGGYVVPVNFFYVGAKGFDSYRKTFDDIPSFLNNSVFNQANIRLDCAPLQHLPDDPKAITSNLYSKATSALVKSHSVQNAINVYIVEYMDITISGMGSAVGFAVLPGPQGFMSPYTCVFVKVSPGSGDRGYLALRIAHEIGHSLGLIHESSCLDNQGIANSQNSEAALSQCLVALDLRNPASSTKDSISNNLMYTGLPGPRLNPRQAFVLQHAPLLTPLVTA